MVLKLRGLGPLTFGMSISEAERAIGREYREADGDGYFVSSQGDDSRLVEGVGVMTQGGNRVVGVYVDKPGIQTRSGIGVGSASAEVWSTYPDRIARVNQRTVEGDYSLCYQARDLADQRYTLAFRIRNNRVAGMTAGLLDQSECDAVSALKAVYRITDISQGDVACYIGVRSARGTETLLADFDMCFGTEHLVGSRVRFRFEEGRVMAGSCEGDPMCTDSETVNLVVGARRVN